MPTPFPLDIVTLENVVYKGNVERLSVMGGEGSLAIEARHAPFVTNVVAAPALVRGAEGEGDFTMALGQGFLLVTADGASLLVDSAERKETIDPARAQAARDRAKAWLASTDPEADLARARAALDRAEARLKVHQG